MTFQDAHEIVGAVELHPTARLGAFVSLNAGRSGRISIGPGVNIKSGARIVSYGGSITIGRRVSIGENSVIYGHGGVSVGEAAAVGPLTFIGSQEHIRSIEDALRFTGELKKPVRIGAGVIISANCVVTAGVAIGDRAFIGAGSLVFDDVSAGWLAYGSPCRAVSPIERNPLSGWRPDGTNSE